jgi:hypothetical protein
MLRSSMTLTNASSLMQPLYTSESINDLENVDGHDTFEIRPMEPMLKIEAPVYCTRGPGFLDLV